MKGYEEKQISPALKKYAAFLKPCYSLKRGVVALIEQLPKSQLAAREEKTACKGIVLRSLHLKYSAANIDTER